jgi:hypothetical protein
MILANTTVNKGAVALTENRKSITSEKPHDKEVEKAYLCEHMKQAPSKY